MKIYIAFIFAVFFAGVSLAQDQTQQQTPPSVQTDTTSGWQLVFSNPRFVISGFQFFPENIIYATADVDNGSKVLLMKSFDGGNKWDTVATPAPGSPVYFTSPMIGYANGTLASRIFWKTTNGGLSWESKPQGTDVNGSYFFPSQDTGLLIASVSYARTTDAGITWKELYPPNGDTKTGVSFADRTTGYVVGNQTGIAGHPDWPEGGYCQKTTDAGATWTQMYTGVHCNLLCCSAIHKNVLYAAGTGNFGSYFARTFNGGISWDTLYLGDSRHTYCEAMSFADSLHGLVVGASSLTTGMILSTTDAGKTWQSQYLPNLLELKDVLMLNNSTAIVCGVSNIYRTTTGGMFSSVQQPPSVDFHVQTFPNPTTGAVTIQYQLPSSVSVAFRFYNMLGQTVGTINNGIQNTGNQQVTFDASGLMNGTYFFQLTAGQSSYTGSFTVQK